MIKRKVWISILPLLCTVTLVGCNTDTSSTIKDSSYYEVVNEEIDLEKEDCSYDIEQTLSYYLPNENTDGLDRFILEIINDRAISTEQQLINKLIDNGIVAKGTVVNELTEIGESTYQLDLSKEFYDLKLGTSAEILMLDAIANTFITNYGFEQLKLTVDGYNYESGHILFEDNDYLTFVDYSGVDFDF